LNITLLCVGKLKEDYLRRACAEYQKRMTPFARFSILEIDEYRLPADPSPAQIEAGLLKEGAWILEKVPPGSVLVSLCVEGKNLSSEEFSRWLFSSALDGSSHFTFVIGGSYGLSEEVKQASRLRLSLSSMTFPHMLARVLLCEQIYRALQIERNTKYHK